jgi:arylsulfatase A-like enzyme
LASKQKKFALYENAISSSYWTMPSVASLFTGMYPSGHGLLADGDKLDQSLATLPKVLQHLGYRNSAFVRNIYVSDYSGMNTGFHDFYSRSGVDSLKKILSRISDKAVNQLQPPGITRLSEDASVEGDSATERLFNAIARCFDVLIDSGSRRFVHFFSDWLQKNRTNPFFAYFHFFETHTPYRAPLNFALKYLSIRDHIDKLFVNHDHLKYLLHKCQMTSRDFNILLSAYDNSIHYADYLIGKIIRILQRQGVYENTMLIILSDHGDNIGDHGLMFHYFCLYDTLIKIPLLIKYPDSIGAVGKMTGMAQNVDIFPTILAILKVQNQKIWQQIQGNDLLGKALPRRDQDLAVSELIKTFGPDKAQYKAQLSPYNRRLTSVRTQNQKFIFSSRGDHECYDLAKDPAESRNLYPHTDNFIDLEKKASIYHQRMEGYYQRNRQKIDGPVTEDRMDESVVKQLKSMGYM